MRERRELRESSDAIAFLGGDGDGNGNGTEHNRVDNDNNSNAHPLAEEWNFGRTSREQMTETENERGHNSVATVHS